MTQNSAGGDEQGDLKTANNGLTPSLSPPDPVAIPVAIAFTTQLDGEHYEAVPNHQPIKIGTRSSILKSIPAHHTLSVEELVRKLGL
ncbi:hypothetical protein K0B96_04935 [Horticoccus luteus]|uniref:Uncharacterized protein n=1 Tax=Horticoccus luteus TaxID=2862869 RepID=A0A8F9TVN4_9BACT|nr:hypothetical protein [Horticoccus luteus]QYM79966.1 hypothetical protein K0B96_04935 [Horticoccus luteus]